MQLSEPSVRYPAPNRRGALMGLGACLLSPACSSLRSEDDQGAEEEASSPGDTPAGLQFDASWVRAHRFESVTPLGPWTHQRYGSRKPTRYAAGEHLGRPALEAVSEAGNSTMRLALGPRKDRRPGGLGFSWCVPALNEQADLRDDDADDAVARVMLSFDGDRSRLSPRDHMLSELAQLISGQPLPYAMLVYVWDHRYPVGTVIPNPHTKRIRQLVVDHGPQRLGRWVEHERDIGADYRHAFGEDCGSLTGLGLMSDSNNTGASATAWFGAVTI